MDARGASVSYRYNKSSDGLWILLLGIPLLIAYGLGLILIIIGIVRMRGCNKAKKTRRAGNDAYGKVAYKVLENSVTISQLTKKRVVFYYRLDNGLLGRTSESINKRVYKQLLEYGNIIPIKKYGNRAVLDFVKLTEGNKPVVKEDEINFSSQDPSYRYKYGEVTKKSIVFLTLAVVLAVGIEVLNNVIIYVSKQVDNGSATGMTLLNLVTVDYVFSVLLIILFVIFFIVGISKMSFYGLASKIRKDGKDGKEKGQLVPIMNKKNGNVTLVLPHKAIFLYTASNGLLIQSEQVINKKMFNKIMEKGEREIPYIELNNYAVIDNKEILGKEPTKLERFFAFLKKYRIFFWFAVLANIYFFATELVHSIMVSFSDGISIFSLAMYFLTLIYISVMELLDAKEKAGNWAYVTTIVFLTCNVIATIGILAIGFMNDGITFVHTSVVNFFGLGSIYFFYLIYKLSNAIINSKKAKRLDLDYERCSNFGDIISNIYTLFNYIAWWFVAMILLRAETRLLSFEIGIFVGIMAINLIVSIIFIVKCANGTGKITKMKKADIKD